MASKWSIYYNIAGCLWLIPQNFHNWSYPTLAEVRTRLATKFISWHLCDKNWDTGAAPLGWGRGWHPRNASLTTCYLAKYGRSRSNGMSMITEIHQKNCTLCIPPFMVIGTDTDWSTIYDFLFVVSSNNGFLSRKNNGDLAKNRNFSHQHVYLNRISSRI